MASDLTQKRPVSDSSCSQSHYAIAFQIVLIAGVSQRVLTIWLAAVYSTLQSFPELRVRKPASMCNLLHTVLED
jgi:hypothetical protein